MAEWTLNAHSVKRSNEVLRRVSLWSFQDRAANPNSYYRVTVGIGSGDGKFDEVGEYDGSTDVLSGNETRDLTGVRGVDRRLREGDSLVIQVESTGTPDLTATGLTVEWTLALAGGNSQGERPVFNTAGFIPEQITRTTVDGVVRALNTSGVTEWTLPIPLLDPVEAVTGQGTPYDDGTVEVADGHFRIHAKRLILSGTNQLRVAGTGRMTIIN